MARYVITDGSRWIQYKNGKYVPTSCPTFADEFSQKQAKNICENQLSKALYKLRNPYGWCYVIFKGQVRKVLSLSEMLFRIQTQKS